MELTNRLSMVAHLVSSSHCIADIGTDHAYIPIYLVRNHKIKRAIASDIHQGPLDIATSHVRMSGLSQVIETRLGSGLSTLQSDECEGAVIAGMGGLMIQKILEESSEVAHSLSWIVVQPMNHAGDLRVWLATHGWKIMKEELAKEDFHLYEAIYAVHGDMNIPDELLAEIGVTLERMQDPLFPLHLKKLMNARQVVLDNIPKDTVTETNKVKREKAALELKRLEGIACQLKLKI